MDVLYTRSVDKSLISLDCILFILCAIPPLSARRKNEARKFYLQFDRIRKNTANVFPTELSSFYFGMTRSQPTQSYGRTQRTSKPSKIRYPLHKHTKSTLTPLFSSSFPYTPLASLTPTSSYHPPFPSLQINNTQKSAHTSAHYHEKHQPPHPLSYSQPVSPLLSHIASCTSNLNALGSVAKIIITFCIQTLASFPRRLKMTLGIFLPFFLFPTRRLSQHQNGGYVSWLCARHNSRLLIGCSLLSRPGLCFVPASLFLCFFVTDPVILEIPADRRRTPPQTSFN